MATHSSTLAWRIPWTEEPGKLQSMGLQKVRHESVTQQTEDMWLTFVDRFRVRISEVSQSCPTFCNPMDCSLPGSSVHGILQARVQE